jgi:hypothetical protein
MERLYALCVFALVTVMVERLGGAHPIIWGKCCPKYEMGGAQAFVPVRSRRAVGAI